MGFKNYNLTNTNQSFIHFTLIVFLALTFPFIWMEGLFMDGLIYATVSHNLSQGIGSNWQPSFTETVLSSFHEHPPLALILQRYFFDLFGDGFYVEKIYSFTTCVLSAVFITGIWRKTFNSSKFKELYWLPVLFWISIPRCFWSYNNNMLENTMGLFSIAAIYCLLCSLQKPIWKQFSFIALSAVFLVCSFLSKGFPGLFPLAFFFLFFLVKPRDYSIKKMLLHSVAFLGFLGLVSFLFFYFHEAARMNISIYLNSQVSESLSGQRVVGSRWYILGVLLQELLIILSIVGLLFGLDPKKMMHHIRERGVTYKYSLLYLLIGFSASVPIMISPKQLGFYIVPSLPYFAIGFAALIAPTVLEFLERIKIRSLPFRIFKHLGLLLIPAILLFAFLNFGKAGYNKTLLEDVEKIGAVVSQNQTISVSQSLVKDWSLMGYCNRKFNISLDRTGKLHKYIITKKETLNFEGYEEVELNLLEHSLLRKRLD